MQETCVEKKVLPQTVCLTLLKPSVEISNPSRSYEPIKSRSDRLLQVLTKNPKDIHVHRHIPRCAAASMHGLQAYIHRSCGARSWWTDQPARALLDSDRSHLWLMSFFVQVCPASAALPGSTHRPAVSATTFSALATHLRWHRRLERGDARLTRTRARRSSAHRSPPPPRTSPSERR